MSGFARDQFLVATYQHMSSNATPTQVFCFTPHRYSGKNPMRFAIFWRISVRFSDPPYAPLLLIWDDFRPPAVDDVPEISIDKCLEFEGVGLCYPPGF